MWEVVTSDIQRLESVDPLEHSVMKEVVLSPLPHPQPLAKCSRSDLLDDNVEDSASQENMPPQDRPSPHLLAKRQITRAELQPNSAKEPLGLQREHRPITGRSCRT